MRHNSVVRLKDNWFYGRVVRMLPDDKVLWICCGKYIHISDKKNLIEDGYKGMSPYSSGRWIPMTSLRKLKQIATKYHGRNVWKTPLDYEFISYDN